MKKSAPLQTRLLTVLQVLLLIASCTLLFTACKKKHKDDDSEEGVNACGFHGWPNSNTVGIQPGISLTASTAELRTTQDGQVFENLDIQGRIYVKHKNVVFRNCRLTGDIYYAVYVEDVAKGGPLLIENCDITGGINSGSNSTFRNNDIYAATGRFKDDGLVIDGDNVLIENNFIHNLRGGPGAHMDGIQILSGNNITIRNNWVELSENPETGPDGGPNAAILVGVYLKPTSNVTVECNMLIMKDAWYPMRIVDITGNIMVRHNRWQHGALQDIPVHYDCPDATSFTWEDNTFDDGIEIPKPH